MRVARRARWGCIAVALSAAMVLAACAPSALPQRQGGTPGNHWMGRLGLQLDQSTYDAHQQSFSAAFELQGDARQGSLELLNPLGSVIAQLRWNPQGAQLQQGDQIRTSDSLEVLLRELIGSDIPVTALFDWLNGKETQATGWQVDLSRLQDGRISARREVPAPAATLRIVLDADR